VLCAGAISQPRPHDRIYVVVRGARVFAPMAFCPNLDREIREVERHLQGKAGMSLVGHAIILRLLLHAIARGLGLTCRVQNARSARAAFGQTPLVTIEMTPIGVVRNERLEAIDDDWDRVNSSIHLDAEVIGDDATLGLRSFSHLEVIYVFDRVEPEGVVRGSRRPRGNPDWPEVGILAQRAKNRPNRIGTTVCELLAVRPGGVVEVRGLDAIDGTPVLDIKPYLSEFGPRGDVLQPTWSSELMAGYWTIGPDLHPVPDAEAWLAQVRRSPSDHGRLDLIVRRPAAAEREVITSGELDPAVGLVGDNWRERGSRSSPDGSAELAAQLNIMNSRCARLVAGNDDRVPLAGDQLYVDLDLSPENLPPGSRLQIGSAVIEVTAKPHTGCAKFASRFGVAAHRWINGRIGRQERLRGICAKVIVAGQISMGDEVVKV